MPSTLRLRLWMFMLLLGAAVLAVASGSTGAQTARILVFPVQGIIGPATSDYLIRGLARAEQDAASLVIIELDTPGGLDPSMRAIIQAILASSVPVATFVSPGGARAASAGTFILYASHIAAMTPASNLGAASPVAVGIGGASDPDGSSRRPSSAAPDAGTTDSDDNPDTDSKGSVDAGKHSNEAAKGESSQDSPASPATPDGDIMAGKVTSDAAAYIRSLAQLRDRDLDFAEQAVLNAKSLSAREALEQGVIEYIARDIPHLLEQVHGLEVKIDDGSVVSLNTRSATVDVQQPGWRTKVLSVITNPQLALVLMMIGIYGLFFELTSPGFALPGVAGMICLLLGLYAFHLLPVNWAGVALIFVGTSLMIAEAFFPSLGILGIGGVVAFVLGGLFLTDTGIPAYDLSLPFLIGLAISSVLLLMMAGTMVARSRKRAVVTGMQAMLGAEGEVTHSVAGRVYAQIHGEHWEVVADEELAPGDRVRVTAVHGLTLHVAPIRASSAHVI